MGASSAPEGQRSMLRLTLQNIVMRHWEQKYMAAWCLVFEQVAATATYTASNLPLLMTACLISVYVATAPYRYPHLC